jgi:hypothetical protein
MLNSGKCGKNLEDWNNNENNNNVSYFDCRDNAVDTAIGYGLDD